MSKHANNATVVPLHPNRSQAVAADNAVTSPLKPERNAAIEQALAQLPQPLQSIQKTTHTRFKAAVQHLFDHVDDALFELADRAASNLEQNVFFESMRELRIQRRAMEAIFVDKIDQGFAGLMGAGSDSLGDTSSDSDDLSLVSKDELEELVAIDAIVSKAQAKNSSALRGVGLRIGSLLSAPLSEGEAEGEGKNPFSPRLLVDGFVDCSAKVNIDIKAKLVLFKLFERYVINDLAVILSEINQALTELGVPVPSGRSRGHKAAASAPRQHSAPVLSAQHAPSSASPPIVGGADQGLYATLQSLLSPQAGLQGEAASTADHGLAPSMPGVAGDPPAAGDLSQRLLAALSQLQQQQLQQTPVAASLREGDVQLLSSQHIQTAIHSATGEVLVDDHSQDVMQLVDMLFSYILEDGNLPAPIKVLLSRLQIPFIKVALADKEFFNKEGHPARRLLNEMATASIGWAGEANGDKPDALLSKIETIVTKVLEEFESNFEIFTLLLTDFVAFQEKERRRAMLFERRALDAEDGKAKAELGRQKIGQALNTLLAEKPLPPVFTQFIQGPWSNILFLIYLRQGEESKQWASALAVVRQLIWTAAPIQSDAHKEKLTKLLPRLRLLMTKGLDTISFNPVKQAQFLDQFSQYHESLIQAYLQPAQSVPAADRDHSRADHIAKAVPAEPSAEAAPEQQVKVSTTALDTPEVASQASTTTDTLPPPSETGEADDNASVADAQYLNLVDNFTVGMWFEKVDQGSTPYRCRLAAMIRGTGQYIFVNRAGVKVAEETRATLALQLQAGHWRTLDDGMLFDRALESVITNLRKTP